MPFTFRTFERPTDLVFEDAVGKLGLLGAKAAENVVYVYSNIRAFRLALELIMKDGREMSEEEIRGRCVACRGCIERALSRGPALLESLRARAEQPYHPEWPWSLWRSAR